MPPGPGRIVDMASRYFDSCVLFAASDLGVFGALAERGKATVSTLATALECDARGLRLLLDAAVAVELLVKDGDHYRNSPDAGIFLVPGAPGDLSKAIRYNRDVFAAWGRLPDLVRTGRPVEAPELHLGRDTERTRNFVLAMHGRALGIGRALIPVLDLEGCRAVLDIGGGPGTYSALLAGKYPAASFTVLDLPDVAAIARDLIAGQNLADRVRVTGGDYHVTPFPAEQDAVLFLGVLHQESPASIEDLMRRAFQALRPGGRVVVMDLMTDATHAAPKFSALFAVNMALTTRDGWVFSDAEMRGWMETAGFTGITVQPLPSPMPHWLMTARKGMDSITHATLTV